MVIYGDEATLLTRPTILEPTLGKAIRTGRERGVAVWLSSQRPKNIPSEVFTESEHFFVFQLTYEDDFRKVASFTGDRMWEHAETVWPEELEGTDRQNHDCIYYSVHRNWYHIFRQP